MNLHISKAVEACSNGGEYRLDGDEYSGLVWYSENIKKPTKAEITAKLAELQAAYEAQAYARKREAEYPSIQELVVALYDTDDKSAVEAKRAAIKAKYPKG